MLTPVFLAGGCSLIIDHELDGKSLGTGGAALDGGPDAESGDADGGQDSPVANADASDGDGGDGGPCTSSSECASAPATPVCDVATGMCVQCLQSTDCANVAEKPVCDTTTNGCVQCLQGSDCTTGFCAAMKCTTKCATDSDCPNTYPQATAVCTGGVCVLGECVAGFGDCDGITTNGCETALDTPNNCGACSNICANSMVNASVSCDTTTLTCVLGTCDPGYADCDQNPSNGCETDVANNDVNNCGKCGTVCMLPNATPGCTAGKCTVAGCASGFKDCDQSPTDGCEVNINTDLDNCGECNAPVCAFAHATGVCTGGACTLGACDKGYADCDGNASNGCEQSLDATDNCGACGVICNANNASLVTCSGGVCQVTCDTGFANCGSVSSGCAVDTDTNVANCGFCGNVCGPGAGTATCVLGSCGSSPCLPGTGNCAGTGCNVNLNSIANCGGCGIACMTANGTPTCTSGACATKSCNVGFADCNLDPTDGCEKNLNTDLANCGKCGTACSFPNANPQCSSGVCGIKSCVTNYADCDMSPGNGCEVDTATDPNNCGKCGVVCSANNGTPACVNGSCTISCSPGFANCDGQVSNGCETNLEADPTHCGACGTACSLPHDSAPTCSQGSCAVGSCVPPFADCDGNPANGCETDTSATPADCGGCGKACNGQNGTPTCIGSTCNIVCNAGYGNCDGSLANGCEANLGSDANNCNKCGNMCPSTNGTPSCVGGACGFSSCNTGYGNCNNAGCKSLQNDPLNCGSCGNVCTVANGTGTCMGGQCAIGSCNTGFADCDNAYATGCETNLTNDAANCGKCATACNLTHAVSACMNSTCVRVSCNAPYANCDGVPTHGCLRDLATDTSNCGACGNVCGSANATPSCVAGACQPICNAGFADCDQNPATGCEANINTDPLNCGACGRACASTNVASVDCSGGSCDSTCALGFANCNTPMQPLPDDGCETNVGSSSSQCGSCHNSCTQQGLECNAGQGSPALCSCSVDAECGGASGSCGANGTCVCNGASCNVGEVCVNQGSDVCSCASNGGVACTAPQTCCEMPAGCVDLTSTASSCGACGLACPSGFACKSSQCVCTADAQCNGGTCSAGGTCTCNSVACAIGQRCLSNGTCG